MNTTRKKSSIQISESPNETGYEKRQQLGDNQDRSQWKKLVREDLRGDREQERREPRSTGKVFYKGTNTPSFPGILETLPKFIINVSCGMIWLFTNKLFVSDVTVKRLHADVFVHLLFPLLM